VYLTRPAPQPFFASLAAIETPAQDLSHGSDRNANPDNQREDKGSQEGLPAE
jgi:hypothetical protein